MEQTEGIWSAIMGGWVWRLWLLAMGGIWGVGGILAGHHGFRGNLIQGRGGFGGGSDQQS